MRMKLFSAATLDDAMALMRAELGQDAVVLSTRNEPGCVEVRAAVERALNPRFAAPVFAESRPNFDATTRNRMEDVMRWHGAPDAFAEIVAQAGIRLMGGSADPGPALAAGLEGVLAFAPLHPEPRRSVLLVGPPGGGKTSVAARLALMRAEDRPGFRPVCADFEAVGGHARLSAYVGRADVPVYRTASSLQNYLGVAHNQDRAMVIDAPAFNPVNSDDMSRLRDLVRVIDAEPVLVLSAEGHPQDLEDNARAFAAVGVRRVVLTKLDAVRRRGGVFAAISSSRLSIAQLSLTHSVKGGLIPATPLRISRLLLESAPETGEGISLSLKGAA